MYPSRVPEDFDYADTVSGMVTRIRAGYHGRLFLREHRRAKDISAPRMADRLGITRESLLRLERKPDRIDWGKAVEYARALGIAPARLLRPPEAISLDAIIEDSPPDVQAMAADIIARLVAKR